MSALRSLFACERVRCGLDGVAERITPYSAANRASRCGDARLLCQSAAVVQPNAMCHRSNLKKRQTTCDPWHRKNVRLSVDNILKKLFFIQTGVVHPDGDELSARSALNTTELCCGLLFWFVFHKWLLWSEAAHLANRYFPIFCPSICAGSWDTLAVIGFCVTNLRAECRCSPL